MGWCSNVFSIALYGIQTLSPEFLYATEPKTPARRDGQVLARRLRLVPGLQPQIIKQFENSLSLKLIIFRIFASYIPIIDIVIQRSDYLRNFVTFMAPEQRKQTGPC